MAKRGTPTKPCSIGGCDDLSVAKELCSHHYYMLRYYGDPLHVVVPKKSGVPCAAIDCDEPVTRYTGAGLCNRHYQIQKWRGDANWQPPERNCRICGTRFRPPYKNGHQYVVLCSRPCQIAQIKITRKNSVPKEPEKTRADSRAASIRTRFRITLAEYDELVVGAACGICGDLADADNPENIVLDHDHATGTIREPLCRKCNWGLGMFNDDPIRMRAAADYIEKHAAAHLELVA